MKNNILTAISIFFYLTILLFTGCSKEEATIENWILGTWSVDTYVQEDYDENGILVSESPSTSQGNIEFREDGTGVDTGGNFIGSEFTWTNTDKTLELTEGSTVTVYDIEEYSFTDFIFSITEDNQSGGTSVERWYLSKVQ